MVLGNHSYLHEYFTYRALSATILALLTALLLRCAPIKNTAPSGKKRRRK